MLLSTTQELRLYSPANAIDNIDTLTGFLDSSEHDFLADKLGPSLHALVADFYSTLVRPDVDAFITSIANGDHLSPYAILLKVCQRIVTFDALARAIDIQAISVNGAGVNIATADDYGKADTASVSAYKASCVKESHAAVNQLLIILENWSRGLNIPSDEAEKADLTAILEAWRTARYFFLSSSLIIPTAAILQEYLNIYDSREKFIALLPDLRYIQEDILAPAIGDDFLDYLIQKAIEGTTDKLLASLIHRLRKCAARHLEARTKLLKVDTDRRQAALNEATATLTALADYIALHQDDLLTLTPTTFPTSPLYHAEEQKKESTAPTWHNNQAGNVIFATPSL